MTYLTAPGLKRCDREICQHVCFEVQSTQTAPSSYWLACFFCIKALSNIIIDIKRTCITMILLTCVSTSDKCHGACSGALSS